jgi:hypothetical protein
MLGANKSLGCGIIMGVLTQGIEAAIMSPPDSGESCLIFR